MPETYQNIQKIDYPGARGKSFYQIFKWGWALVLISCWFLDSTLKRFKDSSGMAIKDMVQSKTFTSNE